MSQEAVKPVEQSPSQPTQADAMSASMQLAWAISSVARLQGTEVDRLRLHDAITTHAEQIEQLGCPTQDGDPAVVLVGNEDWQSLLRTVAAESGIERIEWFETPDPARLPAITWRADLGWAVIRGLGADQHWVLDAAGKMHKIPATESIPSLRLVMPQDSRRDSDKPIYQLFQREFWLQRKTFVEASVASVLINLLAVFTSLYSMQVYDRVIPTQGYSTLLVLTLGVMLTIIFDLVIKFARSHLMQDAVVRMDSQLSRQIFMRFLNIRLDQLPSTVGSLSAQLRGYETIRSFLSASTFYVLVDAPFGLFFIAMIAIIGVPAAALVPLLFLFVALIFGLVMKSRIDSLAGESTDASNQKSGLLVEAIEGAETIKSGAGGWKMLSKWIDTSESSIQNDMAMRNITEKSSYFTATFQQLSYIGLIAVGAYYASLGEITMGALIACSILSGRAMAPVAQIPALIVQAAHAKAALDRLERVFQLESDNHDVDRPIIPDSLGGDYELDRVRFAYKDAPKALSIQSLKIKSGEKVGVIGPIGAGKSTLLRLLTGMYQANEGRILLDGLDIDQMSRQFLGERMGYLQQDHRLFSGTLRENLLIGIADPGDEIIRQAAAQTGLLSAIANHPKGLDLMIAEGGKGLSGGQRQLVAFTRLLLSHPSIWLLDEPTASMDTATEQKCMAVLKSCIKPVHTLVLVTHKLNLLSMVDRVICIANHQVIFDGPRDEVLKRMAAMNKTPVAGTTGAGQAT